MENLNCALIYQAPEGAAPGPHSRLRLTQMISAWDREDPTYPVLDGAVDPLAAIFEAGNLRRDLLPKLAYSISVGDVVALVDNEGEVTRYRCAPVGWDKVQAREAFDAENKPVLFVPKG